MLSHHSDGRQGYGFLLRGRTLDRADRADFNSRVRLEFRGAQISSDSGLLVRPPAIKQEVGRKLCSCKPIAFHETYALSQS